MKTKKTYQITGMSCASCAARIDKVLNAQPGVCEATINYATASAQVVYDSDECSDQSLKTAVQNAGYDLLTDTGNDTNEEAEQAHAKRYMQVLSIRKELFVSGRIRQDRTRCWHRLSAWYRMRREVKRRSRSW